MEPALVSGRDYPNTYRGFVDIFPDDTACAAFLARLRWPGGFICPACKTDSIPWNESRGRLACPICRHQTSVSAGTIFDKTRTSLTTWFEAAWHVTTAKKVCQPKPGAHPGHPLSSCLDDVTAFSGGDGGRRT